MRPPPLAVAFVVLLLPTLTFANAHYADNQPPLQPTPFVALPLGSVRANGWLLKQLEMQRAGLTGHAEEALVELNATSAWRGGDKDNWERSPYYVKGLVPLAYVLDDAKLKARAQVWIDWCLASQREDGFYGPKQNDDWWPRMVSNYFLRDYGEATNDPRVVPFLLKYYRHMLGTLPNRPLKDWGKSRAGDDMDTAIWLYNRTKEPFLLDLFDLLRKQAYDWPTIFRDNTFQSFGKDFQPRHNVNIPQAVKMPAIAWVRSGNDPDRYAIYLAKQHLMREHGLTVGMQSGTEFLAGRSPSQGVEFCSIVEQMLSDETIVRIFGDGTHADRLEQLAYNALPAAWNRDLTALRYYTLPNHVIAKRGHTGYGQNYDNGTVFGPRSGYPCCCFNVHQGWPKFVQNSWAATIDNGLAVIAYAPNTVTAKVGNGRGAIATIVQETDYPFGEEIRFKVTMSAPATFPLKLRTPSWCSHARLTVNGKAEQAAHPSDFVAIGREWKTGDEVVLKLPMQVRIAGGMNASVSVHRGPLIFSLLIPNEKRVVGQPAPKFDEFENLPTAAWNYALAINLEKPIESFDVVSDAKALRENNPFSPEGTPVKLVATGRQVPTWGLAWNGVAAIDPLPSPVQSAETEERITLVPFGSEDLRVTDFPWLGDQEPIYPKLRSFNFDDNVTTGFSWIGGGWFVRGGQLRTTSNGGLPGSKALVEEFAGADVKIESEVTPPASGDAGVIFRVNKASIGPDAYEGYYAGVSSSTGQVIVGRADGKTWTPLRLVKRDIAKDRATKLRVTARGAKIEVFIGNDPKPIVSLTDDRWTSGQVGVRMYSVDQDHADTAFDNVCITPMSR